MLCSGKRYSDPVAQSQTPLLSRLPFHSGGVGRIPWGGYRARGQGFGANRRNFLGKMPLDGPRGLLLSPIPAPWPSDWTLEAARVCYRLSLRVCTFFGIFFGDKIRMAEESHCKKTQTPRPRLGPCSWLKEAAQVTGGDRRTQSAHVLSEARPPKCQPTTAQCEFRAELDINSKLWFWFSGPTLTL